jgi:hypothetical protein
LSQKPKPSGKPVKPKKPLPEKEIPAKVPVPCGLTEERVREIAREEITKWARKTSLPISIKP